MSDLHRVDFALAAEIVGLNGFVSHDAAGDGRYAPTPGLWVKVSFALRTSDHVTSSFDLRPRTPKAPGSFECQFDAVNQFLPSLNQTCAS